MLLPEDPIVEARSAYNTVINDFADLPLAAAKAHIGLAKLDEDAGDIEAARAHYQAVIDSEQAQGYSIVSAAKAGIDGLDELASPVPFATTAPAQTPPAGPVEPMDGE